jgi:hypothetical protein
MNRRNFLLTAPAAAGVGLSMAELFASMVAAQNSTPTDTEANYMVYSAEEIEDDIIALQAKPGSKNLYRDMNFAIDLTVEKNTVAKEFEWHEHRDHIIHILDGETVYELGGTPQGIHVFILTHMVEAHSYERCFDGLSGWRFTDAKKRSNESS